MAAKSDPLTKRLQDLREAVDAHKLGADSLSEARALLLLTDVLLTGIEAQFFTAGGGFETASLISKHPKR